MPRKTIPDSVLDQVPLNLLKTYVKHAKPNSRKSKACGITKRKSLTKLHKICQNRYGGGAFFSLGSCNKSTGQLRSNVCKKVYQGKPYKRKGKEYPGGVRVRKVYKSDKFLEDEF